jgi:hypothetical protein
MHRELLELRPSADSNQTMSRVPIKGKDPPGPVLPLVVILDPVVVSATRQKNLDHIEDAHAQILLLKVCLQRLQKRLAVLYKLLRCHSLLLGCAAFSTEHEVRDLEGTKACGLSQQLHGPVERGPVRFVQNALADECNATNILPCGSDVPKETFQRASMHELELVEAIQDLRGFRADRLVDEEEGSDAGRSIFPSTGVAVVELPAVVFVAVVIDTCDFAALLLCLLA